MKNLSSENEILVIFSIAMAFFLSGFLITRFFVLHANRNSILQYEGVVASFFSLPAVLFSLTTALMATSIWENYSIASKSVKSESQGLMNVISLSEQVPFLKESNLTEISRIYAKSIIEEEWQTLSVGIKNSPETKSKFLALREELFRVANEKNNSAESWALKNAFQTINDARDLRLSFVSFDIHPMRLYSIFVLALFVQISIAFVHLTTPKALIVAMMISTATVLIPISMIVLTLSSPYQGILAISNTPYLKLFSPP